MSLFEADGTSFHIPTMARQVYDVTGAGDTVIATLALSLATGPRFEMAPPGKSCRRYCRRHGWNRDGQCATIN